MAFGFHLVIDLCQLTLLVDDKGGATDAHIGSAHELAFAPGAIEFAELAISICQQLDLETVFVDKLLVFFTSILAHAEHDGIGGGELID